MKIRKAEEKDIPRIMELLGQVLQIHAEIRPDVFIPGTTKYTDSELKELLAQEDKPIYVAAGEDDVCMGYAFCQLKEQPFSTNMVPFIDQMSIIIQGLGRCQMKHLVQKEPYTVIDVRPFCSRKYSRIAMLASCW